MKRCNLIIFEHWGRLKKKRQWIHLIARLLIVQSSLRWWTSSLYESWKTPSPPRAVWSAHLEEESANKEESVESEDPDGIEGMTEEFIGCLARAVKDAQQEEKCCYHCSSLEHFIWDCPLVKASRMDLHLNWKEGTALKKGAWAPHGKVTTPKAPQDGMLKAWKVICSLPSWILIPLTDGMGSRMYPG